MSDAAILPRRPRGRPARHGLAYADTRELLLREGIALLTERGVSATALDNILKAAGVPKGSFYHYFPSKDAFVLAILDAYDAFLMKKLERALGDAGRPVRARLQAFVDDACDGVARFNYRRGCLVGNLGQEAEALDPAIQQRLEAIFQRWEARLAAALHDGVARGELQPATDCPGLAHAFWIGWEGAILRARLMRSTAPMQAFFRLFLGALT